MKIYKKEGDVIQIISFPNEVVEKGEYLLIEDPTIDKGLLVQVIDVQFANVPGLFEDILRDAVLDEDVEGENYDPMDVSSQISILKDTKLLICRIRGVLSNGEIVFGMNYLPSRILSRIIPYKIENFINSTSRNRPFQVGKIGDAELILDVKALDGKLNIITGKKGTGKSHLAKLLILNLVKYGAPCVIFDVNGEYVNLNKRKTGGTLEFGKFITLTPKINMKFTLPQAKLTPVLNMMIYSLDLPNTSARVFIKIWRELEKRGELSLSSLGEAILRWDCHESVRDALYARYSIMVESGLFTDNVNESLDFEFLMKSISNGGGGVVINLKSQPAMIRRMIVELTLNKLVELLSAWKLQAIFLFAEEAHLYLRETYWDDIVTRMRHLGIFSTFITNQPDTIQETIYRQADNVFLFNFSNEHDLDVVSKAAKIDSETVKKIVKELPPYYCLIIGDIVKNFPVVVKVESLEFETMGETRFFFKN